MYISMHLHTYAHSVTDLQNSVIIHAHKNKGKILIHISVEEISGTSQLISHSPFEPSITTKRACFFFLQALSYIKQFVDKKNKFFS